MSGSQGGGKESVLFDSTDAFFFWIGASWGLVIDFLKTDRLGGAEGGATCIGGTVDGTAGGCLVGFGDVTLELFLFCAAILPSRFALGAGLGKLLLDFFSGRGGGTSSLTSGTI